MQIVKTQLKELDRACRFFEDAIAYQKSMGFPHYYFADRKAIREDIVGGLHYLLKHNNKPIASFCVHDSDGPIWGERDIGNAIYLHKVIVDTEFKGQRIFQQILDWVVSYTKGRARNYIRIDTWADNPPLENYYKSFGFETLDTFQTPNTEAYPPNSRGNKVVLMELGV